eukprot:gene16096-22238_t
MQRGQSIISSLYNGFAGGFATSRAFSAASGESLTVGGVSLLRLPERAWGASATLSAATISAAGVKTGGRIAVLRDAFNSFDEPTRPLSQVVTPLGGSAGLAVSSDVCTPHSRVIVDEYEAEASGNYKLKSMGTDLLPFLHRNKIGAALVPDVKSASLSSLTAVIGATKSIRQSSNEVLMVAPTSFGYNEQAAQDNSFMHVAAKPGEGSELTRKVLREFAGLHHQLTQVHGVNVNLFEHSLQHGTPDACFPNNWFSTHPAGEAAGGVKESTLVLYPMKCPNRAAERRADIIEVLKHKGYTAVYDQSPEEANQKYFEGTGVLVIDRINGVVYVDISERADASLAEQWTERMGYKKLVTFRSTDLRKKGVYHTNVMMAIGTGVAIVCAESVADPKERQNLISSLSQTHEVVQISLDQMDHLCGNALEVENGNGLPVMAMSTQAYNAFTDDQIKAIRRHVVDIAHAPIDTLEKVGGGGVRCTMAEIF